MTGIGIIGCGRIAQRRHVPEYASHQKARLVGYFDYMPERGASLARTYGGRVYRTLEELFADPAIDAVSICAANNAHADLTVQALEAGKHVLCEKPMATTVEDCQRMLRAAEKSGKFLMIAQNQRYNTGHMRAKELIAQGAIGTPLTFKTSFCHGGPENWCRYENDDGEIQRDIWFFDKNVASMGAMADLGIHKVDLIQYLLDDEITEVTAKILTLDKRTSDGNLIELEDNALCIYRMSKNIYGTMTVSWTNYGSEDNSTVIFGTKGVMRLYEHPDHTIAISTDRGDKIFYDLDVMMTNEDQRQSGVIRAFVNAIEKGDYSDAADARSVNALRAVLAGFESSREDRTILLRDFHPDPEN